MTRAAVVACFVFAAGCGSGTADAPPTPRPSLVLSVPIVRLRMGDSVQASGVVTGSTSSQAVVWTTSDTTVATVTPGGVVTASSPGTVQVSATSGKLSASTTIEVEPALLTGAGDIGICGAPGPELTARILDTMPGAFFTAGDNVYMTGAPQELVDCWQPTWGRHKAKIHPAIGNHDVEFDGGSAYYQYWGSIAGDAGLGYYSYNIGSWHVVVLNSNIARKLGSPQDVWLRADLAKARNARCTLAIWHHPRFSSATEETTDPTMAPFWDALYQYGADLVINGHSHVYERFAPQTPAAIADTVRGIRQITVGTGGAMLLPLGAPEKNSVVRWNMTHGVLKLTLNRSSYDWQFVGVASEPAFTDAGHGECKSYPNREVVVR